MKLYSIYSPSHRRIKDEWFLPSLKDDYELVIEECGQICPGGTFGRNDNYIEMMSKKVNLVIGAIKDNWDKMFVYSDIDVQFFKPTIQVLKRLIKSNDMVIQRDTANGYVCSGFFAALGNKKNLRLWQDTRAELLNGQKEKHDQDIFNELLLENSKKPDIPAQTVFNQLKKVLHKNRRFFENRNLRTNPYKIKWDYLPVEFFCPGPLLTGLWEPGIALSIPTGIILHHANHVITLENKIAQLQYIKNTANHGEII